MRKLYRADATPWEWGWEIDLFDEGATQTFGSWTRRQAEYMVRDYLACMHDIEPDSFDVHIHFKGDIPSLPYRLSRRAAAAWFWTVEAITHRERRARRRILAGEYDEDDE